MKRKIIIIASLLVGIISILISSYFIGLMPVSKNSKTIEFNVQTGQGKVEIIENLKTAGLIKSKMSLYVYVALNRNLNLQAGLYELNTNMSAKDIIRKIDRGKIKEVKNTFTLTFIEGKRLIDYAKVIATALNISEEEVLKTMNDKVYLQELIDEYWFLTDEILKEGIYYGLEGYLFASTYEFYNNSSVKDIIKVMLDTLASKLNSYKDMLNGSEFSIHEYLTMASVVELEEKNNEARKGVAGVFYNRLKISDSLGSDVTTYYAAKKDFTNELLISEINDCNNGYNTRGNCNKGKLPIGPICSPSLVSIISAIEPANHDYYFFVADKNNVTYFTKSYSEHLAKINELKESGLWYEF